MSSVRTARRSDAGRAEADLAAGYRLFSDKGYLATSIEDIAAEAGVARPTVFTAVGPKATILRLVVDHALAGDDHRSRSPSDPGGAKPSTNPTRCGRSNCTPATCA